ncbi:MAG: MgtC/SapB family protein [Candidatus Omnitrophota bacterium]|nr:MgtC/SapB family protein [Candidatus Omnitrophota bacterium]
MTSWIILLRILLSTLFGGLIGIEREVHGCAAGLRTHILVSIGSTLFMMTSIIVCIKYGHVGEADPSRIAAGVVTGIGFLGAGAIIRYGSSIRGLTTAASIWAVAAVGLAVGVGMYEAAGISTFVVLVILILSRLEERMELKRHRKKLAVRVCSDGGAGEDDIRCIIESFGGRIKHVETETDKPKGRKVLLINLALSRFYHKEVIKEISSLHGVENVEWK